jgi:hypothetical protein
VGLAGAEKGLPYLLAAAEQARASYALARAVTLLRQDVQCGANEVLGGFKLKNDARAKRVWYEYKCCKAPEPVAAAAPQAGGRVSKIAGEPWSPGTDLSEKQLAVIEHGIAGGTNYSFRVMEQYDKQKGNSRAPVTGGATVSAPEVPGIGNNIAKQSGDNEQAKLDSGKGGGSSAIVAAPTINNNNNVQNTPVKLAPRNGDSTVNKYMQSRWAF